MFFVNGVWDAAMRRRLTGYAGLFALFMLAYLGAQASGSPFFIRLVF
ncbi:MAG: hypothetical protein HZC41_03605 [Chloroflexi bacterium]|nr:hypothetical protein [Chloroflexota bacterium]